MVAKILLPSFQMKKVFFSLMLMIFIGISSSFAQEVVFKLKQDAICSDNSSSYWFEVIVNDSYDTRLTISKGDDGYWYKDCAGTLDGEMISDSRNVSINKAVELLWTEYLNNDASSVSIEW